MHRVLLALALVGCGARAPVSWPAQPFTIATAAVADTVESRIADRVRQREVARIHGSTAGYVRGGGELVEGTVSTGGRSWAVRGSIIRTAGGVDLDVRDGSHYLLITVARDRCSISTSIPYPETGACTSLTFDAPRIAFDVDTGQAPDIDHLHVELTRPSELCPGWMFDELRTLDFHDDGARVVHTSEGDEGESVAPEGESCCWDRAHYRSTTWIDRHCPGGYGVDVVVDAPEHLCAPCSAPPHGCGGPT